MDAMQELGLFLRTERERRGLTIEQVASATKIAVKYIHALESDQFSDLPAKPFVRGFVSSYARFIGLDSKEVLRQFEPYIEAKAADRPNREGGHKGYAFENKDGDQRSRLYLSVVLGLMIVVGVVALVLKPGLRGGRKHGQISKLKTEKVETPAEPVAVAPSAVPSPEPSSVPPSSVVAAPTPAVAVAPSPVPAPLVAGANPADLLDSGKDIPLPETKHKTVLKALGSIWVRYQVDERPLRKFIMRTGATLILKSRSRTIFQISNPRSATINYNGRGAKLIADAAGKQEIAGTTTFLFGDASGLAPDAIFPGEKPLPVTPDPSPEPSPSPSPELSTPTP